MTVADLIGLLGHAPPTALVAVTADSDKLRNITGISGQTHWIYPISGEGEHGDSEQQVIVVLATEAIPYQSVH